MTRSALSPRPWPWPSCSVPGPALAAPAPPPEAPRALSEAERQAVVLAAEYLDRGPAAWWDRLASTSPLRRLGREAALAEIEVRAGAPAGAEWALEAAPEEISRRGAVFTLGFPSGVDDTLVLDLVQENGGWKIASLRIAAEPVAAKAAGVVSLPRRRQAEPLRSAPPALAGDPAFAGQDPRLAAPGRRGGRRPAPGRRRARAEPAGAGDPAGARRRPRSRRARWPPCSCPACWRRDRRRRGGVESGFRRAALAAAAPARPHPGGGGGAAESGGAGGDPGGRASPARSPSSGGPRTCSGGWICAGSTGAEGFPSPGAFRSRSCCAPGRVPAPRGGAHGDRLPARGRRRRGARGAALRIRPGLPAARLSGARQAVPASARRARRAPGRGLVHPGEDRRARRPVPRRGPDTSAPAGSSSRARAPRS